MIIILIMIGISIILNSLLVSILMFGKIEKILDDEHGIAKSKIKIIAYQITKIIYIGSPIISIISFLILLTGVLIFNQSIQIAAFFFIGGIISFLLTLYCYNLCPRIYEKRKTEYYKNK